MRQPHRIGTHDHRRQRISRWRSTTAPTYLHGGTKNFANRLWESRVETNRVVMSLLSEDGDQNYPGEAERRSRIRFRRRQCPEITYLAKTDKTTVVNLTNHVYFNLAGDGSGSILDHELRLNSSKVLEMNDKQIPTGKLLDAAGTPQDFRQFRPFRPGIGSEFNHIRDFKGYDHPFVIDGWQPNILGEVGELREKGSGRCVKILSSQPSVMVYTGNWLAGGCPGNQDRRTLRRLRRRGDRMPELPRRREPSRFPVAAARTRRTLLPEDRLPVRHHSQAAPAKRQIPAYM
ncbi:MAG: hypothetical protein ACLUQ6_01340 [Alistipes onderdonkii]